MDSEIEHVVKRLFPLDLTTQEAFEDWVTPLREDAQPGAANLVENLRTRLEKIKSDRLTGGMPNRDGWELFGGEGDKTIKSAASIRSKLARDFISDKSITITTPHFSKTQLQTKVLEFGDLGRVRIVADFASDIASLMKNLFTDGKFLGTYDCPKGVKDFVFDPSKRDGLKGHRARQFSVRVPISICEDFGFEVQLMTRLQHAWDRRNHPLYEWQREHPEWASQSAAVELAVNDFACAEALHLVDQQADANWQRLQHFLKEAQA